MVYEDFVAESLGVGVEIDFGDSMTKFVLPFFVERYKKIRL